MNIVEIVDELERKIIKELGRDDLTALALTGSRAAGYNGHSSDWDFFAIFQNETDFDYWDFDLDGNLISLRLESSELFEERMQHRVNTYHAQARFVWMPYQSFIGQQYLAKIEQSSRVALVEAFAASLPIGVPVEVPVARMVEWPFIDEALVNPYFASKFEKISRSNVLEDMIPKYIAALALLGFKPDGNDTCTFVNDGQKRKEKNSSIKKMIEQSSIYRRKRKHLSGFRDHLAVLYTLLQAPERTYNLFYQFPRYEQNGSGLVYAGPTLKEFIDSRQFFSPLRNAASRTRELLLKP